MMQRSFVLLALPFLTLTACGDAADESDDPPMATSDLAPAESEAPAVADTPLPENESASTDLSEGETVPPTDQDAQYQDSVTQPAEAAQ